MKKIITLTGLIICLLHGVSVGQNIDSMRSVNATNFFNHKEYDKALRIIDTLIDKYPGVEACVIFKASVLGAMGRDEAGNKVINNYMKDEDNQSVGFYMKRGRKKVAATLYSHAIDDYDRAYEKLDNDDSRLKDLLMERSRARYAIRRYKSIYPDMQVLLAEDSTDYDALIMMVNILNWLNDTDEIMTYLNRCVRLYPNEALVYGNLSYRYQNMGNYEKAIELNNKAIELDGNSTYYYSNRGFEKYKLNDMTGAMEDINKAIEINPDNSFAYKNRALVYIVLKENDKACADLQTATDKGFDQQYGPDVAKLIRANCN